MNSRRSEWTFVLALITLVVFLAINAVLSQRAEEACAAEQRKCDRVERMP